MQESIHLSKVNIFMKGSGLYSKYPLHKIEYQFPFISKILYKCNVT
jgi:hypothetical protein